MKKIDLQITDNEKILLTRYCEKLNVEPAEIETPNGLSVDKLMKLIKKSENEQSKKDIEEYKKSIETDNYTVIQINKIKQLTVNDNTSNKVELLCDWCKLYYKVKEYSLETMNKSALHPKVIDICENMIDVGFKSSYPYLKLLNIYIHYDEFNNYTRISDKYKAYKQNRKKG